MQLDCPSDLKSDLSQLPESRRTCPGVRLWVTLVIRHILSHAWPQFIISLTHQISLIVLIYFYQIQCNVTVHVTYAPFLASWSRRDRRICPGVKLQVNLLIKHIVTYAWPQLKISLTHQINLIIIRCDIIYNVTVNINYNPILASRPWCRRLCPGLRL